MYIIVLPKIEILHGSILKFSFEFCAKWMVMIQEICLRFLRTMLNNERNRMLKMLFISNKIF